MVQDGLKVKLQIKKWIEYQSSFLAFTVEDWTHLEQIASILIKFEEFTLVISRQRPQISLAIPIYYEPHDLLNDASTMQREFTGLNIDIADTVSAGLVKYKKYYDFMDAQDAYYVALVLDPRLKIRLLEKELDEEAAATVIKGIKELLHQQYPLEIELQESEPDNIDEGQGIEARAFQKLLPKKKKQSDID
jgi:hypothetical protein